jgi:uncharacterized protein (TIGR03067 family)
MKARLPMIVAVGLLLAADNAQEEAAKKDLKKLQGTWNLVSAMQDGKALAADKVQRTTIVIKGHEFHFPGLAEYATAKEGTFKLDATKKPKRMDSTSTQGEVMLGIYELEGDLYKVCFAPAGKKRPTDFVSKSGSKYILQVEEVRCPCHSW